MKKKYFATFPLIDSAVETSGSYEKYVTFNGKRYSHIIDPRTGYPASGLVSVSVFAKKTELADALATSIFVMGKEVGIDFINQLPSRMYCSNR
ncbi:FAD:protein FMN transferase [Flavobacterium sp.]|uniref:FAD:protein FMN transferase n=1 Tax=Flavobacterium sp. TaxID=239 RepID=UPI003529C513